ncbi:hypothetical protein [Synechococcus sp. CC9616]|uniref:hypothetical protein n=1 Tax=Synechococcus sp. CC9616 TaxID=110663 RepID=UPI0004AC7670|nr:hypothetical protein [Synechococcus sp. CC9616]
MAILRVPNSASQISGTIDQDLIVVPSGLSNMVTIYGLQGADTVEFLGGDVSAKDVKVEANGGPDQILFSGIVLGNGMIRGGAGGDLINFNSGTNKDITIQAGDGNDTITVSGADLGDVNAGGGFDYVSYNAGHKFSANNKQYLLGAGKDTLSFADQEGSASNIDNATVYGGGGNDLIEIKNSTSTNNFVVNGDAADANVYGNDLIDLQLSANNGSFKGNGGRDTILISAELGKDNEILGNAGRDSIVISASFDGSDNSIGGGSGGDTIQILNTMTASAHITGGGGADSIYIDFTRSEIKGTNTLKGGQGSDTIDFDSTFSGTESTGLGHLIVFDQVSDSTTTNSDQYIFRNNARGASSGTTMEIDTRSIAVPSQNYSIDVDGLTVSGGIARFSAVTSLAERVEVLDANLKEVGQYAVMDGLESDNAYFFMQGGSGDDLLVEVQNKQINVKHVSVTQNDIGLINFMIG